MTPLEPGDSPPRERPAISGGIQFGAMIGCAIVFGIIERWSPTWPALSLYAAELVFAFGTRFVLGIIYEKPRQILPAWRALHWRVLWFESIVWSCSLVFFLGALSVGERKNWFATLLGMGIVYFVTLTASKKLISTFPCPHCHQAFFKKEIKDEGGSFPFSLSKWPNTLCQHCNWPLDKLVD